MTRVAGLACLVVVVLWAGCGVPKGDSSPSDGSAAAPRTYEPIDPAAAVFWDRQTTETRQLLLDIVDEFNRTRPGALPIKVEHVGGYTEIYRKVSASIQAGALPSMAVGYESMTTEYVQAGAVALIEDYVHDPQRGLSEADLNDFFPAVIETNRYPSFGNKMYSFPFCKSVLVMYFNKRVLEQAGIAEPPQTWDQFIEDCRLVKQKTGRPAYAVNVDCSTIDGMIFSMGGEVVNDNKTLFDSPESVRVFKMFETLAKEELAYQIAAKGYDDETALSQDRTAFAFRSSSGRTNMALLMADEPDKWGMVRIPQADPSHPRTVLYGPNICIFNTTPEQQQAAWEFVKFFTSPDMSVRWALGSGYLPIRKSAENNAALQQFWKEWPYNRSGFDCLPFARSEPNLAGWQEVRTLVENAQTAVLTGVKTAEQAATDLKQAADAVLSQY